MGNNNEAGKAVQRDEFRDHWEEAKTIYGDVDDLPRNNDPNYTRETGPQGVVRTRRFFYTWPDIIFIGLMVVLVAVVGNLFLGLLDTKTFPMPCDEDEVYVWVEGEYPNKARCIDQTDHAGHMG